MIKTLFTHRLVLREYQETDKEAYFKLKKFKQNNDLKAKLIDTDTNILAECAVQDKIWGIGLSMKDEKRFDMQQWQGQNLLGFSLMRVRDVLK